MSYERPDPRTGLTKRQAVFCELFCNYGDRGGARAYRDAGFAAKNADGDACKLLRRPHIQRRIKEIMAARPSEHAPMAFNRVLRVVEEGKDVDALAAAKLVLNLAGMQPSQQINVAHDHQHEHHLQLPDPQQFGMFLRRLAASGVGISITDESRFTEFLSVLGHENQQSVKLIDITPDHVE